MVKLTKTQIKQRIANNPPEAREVNRLVKVVMKSKTYLPRLLALMRGVDVAARHHEKRKLTDYEIDGAELQTYITETATGISIELELLKNAGRATLPNTHSLN